MKFLPSKKSDPGRAEASGRIDRRRLVAGAGIVGAAAIAAHALHRKAIGAPVAAADSKPGAQEGEGYRLTEHVRRYYETTKA